MADIRNAINAGKQVTAHQSNISHKGWNGSDYIILDPTTGTGAYLIDGGANGARLIIFGSIILAMAISTIIGIGVFGFATAPVALIGTLAVPVVVGHIVSLIMLGLGALIAGDALYYQKSKEQCKIGFALMGGGFLASASSMLATALAGTSVLGETAVFFLTLLETLGIRVGGGIAGFYVADNICDGVNEIRE